MYLTMPSPLSRERLSSRVGVGSVVTGGQLNFLASGWKVTGAASVVKMTNNIMARTKPPPPSHVMFDELSDDWIECRPL